MKDIPKKSPFTTGFILLPQLSSGKALWTAFSNLNLEDELDSPVHPVMSV